MRAERQMTINPIKDADTDAGAAYDPNRYKVRTYKEMNDPLNKILNQSEQKAKPEVYGSIFVLEILSKAMSSYEIYMLVEDNLNIEIDDLSIICDSHGKYTGLTIVQLKEQISQSKLNQLVSLQFKGKEITAELITTQDGYKQLIKSIVKKKLETIKLPMNISVPLVFVYGFNGELADAENYFGQCGAVLYIEKKEDHLIVYFSKESSAKSALINLNLQIFNDSEIRVSLFYPRSAERCFGVRFSNNNHIILKAIREIGNIESHKETNDNSLYILMQNVESSIKACMWLNNQQIDGSYIQTFFMKYSDYKRI